MTSPDTPLDTSLANERRCFHIRTIYSRFFSAYTLFTNASSPEDFLPKLMGEHHDGLLKTLQKHCQKTLTNHNHEPYSQHLKWAIQALFHSAEKLKANHDMIRFHASHHPPGTSDPGQDAFVDTLSTEMGAQQKTMALLFNNAKDLLRLMLTEQSTNDLLLRLLIEEESLPQTLWGTSVLDLFSDIFPDQPEAGFVQAGKSYFMGQWLEEALQCYELSLDINKNLSEPRRQTHLIRAMLKDRDRATLPPKRNGIM